MLLTMKYANMYTKICRHSYAILRLAEASPVASETISKNSSDAKIIELCTACTAFFDNMNMAANAPTLKKLSENYEDIYAPGAEVQRNIVHSIVLQSLSTYNPILLMDESVSLSEKLAKSCHSWLRLSPRKQSAGIGALFNYSSTFHSSCGGDYLPKHECISLANSLPYDLVDEMNRLRHLHNP